MSHPFIEGELFEDRVGEYTIDEIIGEDMRLTYTTGAKQGETSTMSLSGQWRVYRKLIREKASLFRSDTEAFFKTLGYLAAKATLDAEVPQALVPNFESRYKDEGGGAATQHQDHYFPLDADTDKWAPELRVYFPRPSTGLADLDFGVDIDAKSTGASNTFRVNNNKFWWQLVRMGFKLGAAQDASTIRNNIPTANQDAFDEGLEMD